MRDRLRVSALLPPPADVLISLVHQLIVCKDRLAMERDEPSLAKDGEGKEAGKRGLASGSVPVAVA